MPTLGYRHNYFKRLDKPTCLLKLIQHPDISVLCSILITMQMASTILGAWVGQTSNKATGQAIHNGFTSDCSPFGLDKLHFDHFGVDDFVTYSSHEIIDISCETLVAEPSDHFVPSTAAAELG